MISKLPFTPAHHEQGFIIILAVLMAIFLKSFSMVFAFIGYFIMHLCYGGTGTFQRPLMSDKKAGVLDILIIFLETLCIILYFILGAIGIGLKIYKMFGIDLNFTIF